MGPGRRQSLVDLDYETPDAWAHYVLKYPFALLSDHAYLERKAASNALDLLNRWPEPNCPDIWTTTLSSIARDEALHLNQVLRVLRERGGRLERLHRSSYASDLRGLVRVGKGPSETVDRLLVSALIEARSCERFGILARVSDDEQLSTLYDGLHIAEQGHYKTFLQLAGEILAEGELQARWAQMREQEAVIIQNQPVNPGLHSRCPIS